MRGTHVGGKGGRGGDFVGENLDFEVGLNDGHFDVEGGNFVGEALPKRRSVWFCGKGFRYRLKCRVLDVERMKCKRADSKKIEEILARTYITEPFQCPACRAVDP